MGDGVMGGSMLVVLVHGARAWALGHLHVGRAAVDLVHQFDAVPYGGGDNQGLAGGVDFE